MSLTKRTTIHKLKMFLNKNKLFLKEDPVTLVQDFFYYVYMADMIKINNIIKLQSEKLQELSEKVKKFQDKINEINEAKDNLSNEAQNHSAEWVERQKKNLMP